MPKTTDTQLWDTIPDMHFPWFNKLFNSVFTKMLAIILLAGIGINVALWGFFWAYRAMAGRPFHRNIHQYLNYIIRGSGNTAQL